MLFSKSKNAFYAPEFRAEYEAAGNWPDDLREVSGDVYAALMAAQSNGAAIQSDASGNPVAIEPPALTIDQLKAAKTAEINDAASKCAAQLTAGYPDFELQTWEIQRAESLAWNANQTAPTPTIDAMANARGIDRLTYLQKTLAKVQYFQVASAYLVGTRQKYADQAAAAKTQASLDKVVPVFTLPAP